LQGVVSGTLLVTPNAVMFDPNVSDPLVLDQGAETYGVILPLDVVVHAGIYSDIAHMKVFWGECAFRLKWSCCGSFYSNSIATKLHLIDLIASM